MIEPRFKIGQAVEKYTGDYRLGGFVRGVIAMGSGKLLYAVEHGAGLCHLYSDANLRPLDRMSEIGFRAASDVITERDRQVTAEGWSVAHDDDRTDGSLATAAACYAAPRTVTFGDDSWFFAKRLVWPWARGWWKPKSRRRDLVRAGALILAEIERIDRAAPAATAFPSPDPPPQGGREEAAPESFGCEWRGGGAA